MVINHLEKLFVTSDASTIVTEMDVYHPAAKLLVMAAKAQAGEVGDGTNLVRPLCSSSSQQPWLLTYIAHCRCRPRVVCWRSMAIAVLLQLL